MLPRLHPGQQVFIEITNPIHGGLGWELGKRLWSPVYSKIKDQEKKHKAWKIMEGVKKGDIIIHLVDQNHVYHFYGISFVNEAIKTTNIEPPTPDKWANMSPYQYVELTDYFEFPNPVAINHFFKNYLTELKRAVEIDINGRFYVVYKEGLRVSQRYMAGCSPTLYRLFSSFAEELGINVSVEFSSEGVATPNAKSEPTKRILVETSRIVRDTVMSKMLKLRHGGHCQICNLRIALPSGGYYSEGHHIKPLGGDHSGPDIPENIIIVCPTHHAEFDHRAIAIEPDTLIVKHIDKENLYHNQPLAYERENLGKEFLEYHFNLFEAGYIQELPINNRRVNF